MPRYRFTAVDSYGTAHDGSIDAPTEADARNKLASNGLAVRSVEEAGAGAGVAPPDVPRRAAPKSGAGSGIVPAGARSRAIDRPDAAPERRRGSPWPLVLSLLALLISVGTAAYTLTRRDRDPLSNRLGKYDFSNPEAAFMSEARMEANGDVLAMLEFQQKSVSRQFREKHDTLRVDPTRTRTFRGKTILFFEFEQNRTHLRDVVSMERDDQGVWRRSFVADEELQNSDPRLFDEVRRWKASGGRGGPGDGPDDEP